MAEVQGDVDAAAAQNEAADDDGPVGTSMGIGDDMGELSDDAEDNVADAGPGQEADEGHDVDMNLTDEVDYSPYESEDLTAMQKEFSKTQNALPARHKADAHAIRSQLAALTANVKSTTPATFMGFTYNKDRHTDQDKQNMVQAFVAEHGKTIDAMSIAHSAEVNAANKDGKKGGLLSGAMSGIQSPAGMAMGVVGGVVGTIGMALSGMLQSVGLQHNPIDMETDLDALMQEVGLKEKDAQSDVSDPQYTYEKNMCAKKDGYRWDDATLSCVIDTTKSVSSEDPIDVVDP
jgi:hypothetical protein